jgi:hypothetical protein
MEGRTDRWKYNWTDRQMDGLKNGWIKKWMDELPDGKGKLMVRYIHEQMNIIYKRLNNGRAR